MLSGVLYDKARPHVAVPCQTLLRKFFHVPLSARTSHRGASSMHSSNLQKDGDLPTIMRSKLVLKINSAIYAGTCSLMASIISWIAISSYKVTLSSLSVASKLLLSFIY
ncbi:hypothetical protein TNCV_3536741 [Trichonephila clavipes]|uniref:Uncharacterized protein n=1 Tax=Trichonephila clavipes TaxID=2585209 RepID=A0A8X7B910_TRICX|nr:hypothetical protein TNCV_3536741 [Trichonephila clavipes]